MRKLFMYTQNSSGGSFVDLAYRIFIEAKDQDTADALAESIGVYFDGCIKDIDCPCCGDRWESDWSEVTFEKETDILKELKFDFDRIADWDIKCREEAGHYAFCLSGKWYIKVKLEEIEPLLKSLTCG